MFPSTAGSLASGFIIKDGVVMTTQEAAALAASPAVAAVARTATNGGAGAPSRAPSSAAASGAARVFVKSTLPLEERMARCLSVGEECIQVRGALFGSSRVLAALFTLAAAVRMQPEELLALLKARDHPVCYDGFEPSGRMHIAQGILKAINVWSLRISRASAWL